MNWLDLGLVVFIIIFIIIGIKKGFMTSVLSNFSFTIAAFFLYKPVANLLNGCFNLENAIYNSYLSKFISKSSNFDVNLLEIEESALGSFVSSTLALGGISFIPRLMFNWFINTRGLYTKLHSAGIESRTLGQIVSQSYATFFTTVISFVLTMLLLYLVLFLIKLLVNKLREIGFVKGVDTFLGAIYGIGHALLILIIVCIFLKMLSPISFVSTITNYISQSFFGKLIYNQINNLLDNYFSYNDIINSLFNH